MQGLAVIAALLAIGYGFGMAGVLGSLTGLVAALGVGSGLAIAIAESATGVAASGGVRGAQRISGFLAAGACLTGAVWGGWTVGWLWGLERVHCGRSRRRGPCSLPRPRPRQSAMFLSRWLIVLPRVNCQM